MNESDQNGIINALTTAYWMEAETVLNYLAASTNLDGLRSEEVRQVLALDVQEELNHAITLAARIRELGGTVPGSLQFTPQQDGLQPPADSTDVGSVIHGVIAVEEAVIRQYRSIIRLCEGTDYVTQDLCIGILASEEKHCRDFRGFLREFERSTTQTPPTFRQIRSSKHDATVPDDREPVLDEPPFVA